MDLPDGWTTETVRANGIDVQCYRVGEGDPVVLAHGFYDNGRRWVPLAEDLAAEYEAVAYDARGHGRSDAPPEGYGIDDRVADLAGVVAGLDLADPILIGHSMGGSTVAWTAAKRPELPRAAVLEDPAGMYGPPDLDPEELVGAVREKLAERAERTVEEEIAEHYPDRDPEQARRLAVADTECSEVIAEIPREGYPPVSDALAAVECPTLVLKSDVDHDRRVQDLVAAEALSNGRLVHVAGAGHYVFGTEYEAAYAELRAFLERV
jgi:pimeloyl-ACP methyl ester carboxylesterase